MLKIYETVSGHVNIPLSISGAGDSFASDEFGVKTCVMRLLSDAAEATAEWTPMVAGEGGESLYSGMKIYRRPPGATASEISVNVTNIDVAQPVPKIAVAYLENVTSMHDLAKALMPRTRVVYMVDASGSMGPHNTTVKGHLEILGSWTPVPGTALRTGLLHDSVIHLNDGQAGLDQIEAALDPCRGNSPIGKLLSKGTRAGLEIVSSLNDTLALILMTDGKENGTGGTEPSLHNGGGLEVPDIDGSVTHMSTVLATPTRRLYLLAYGETPDPVLQDAWNGQNGVTIVAIDD